MQRIGAFEKVSLEQFQEGFSGDGEGRTKEQAERIWEEVRLPERATRGSAGYDFFAPFSFSLEPGESVKIPTGVRARMKDGWVLLLFPRSGLGFKYRLQLDNTVGVIDSDYYNSENEGHIFIKLTNDSKEGKVIAVEAGKGFAQGIFLPFGITEDDSSDGERNGGFGSTMK